MSRRAAVCAKATATATICGWLAAVMARSTEWPPAAAVTREQFVGFLGPFAAGAIGRKVLILRVAKRVEERLHDAPAGFDAVGPRIKNGVADHAVINQRFIAGTRCRFEIIIVAECHAHAAERDGGSRNLGVELETDAFIGLNANH